MKLHADPLETVEDEIPTGDENGSTMIDPVPPTQMVQGQRQRRQIELNAAQRLAKDK